MSANQEELVTIPTNLKTKTIISQLRNIIQNSKSELIAQNFFSICP